MMQCENKAPWDPELNVGGKIDNRKDGMIVTTILQCYTRLKMVNRLHYFIGSVVFVFIYLVYILLVTNELIKLTTNDVLGQQDYLIDTETCKLRDWPVLDIETWPIFRNVSLSVKLCNNRAPLQIARTNNTWVTIRATGREDLDGWQCWARELVRNKVSDGWEHGPDGFIGPLGKLTNFDRQVMGKQTKHPQQTWDSVKVLCSKPGLFGESYQHYYSVLLIQKYYPQHADDTRSEAQGKRETQTKKTNVLLLGIDSISRLNFLRHFIRTKAFIDEKGFIPLLGYHKVGENSFPNIFPMLTGHEADKYWNDNRSADFRFDSTPLIFYDFDKNGYLTAFIEDMPWYGFFTYGKPGFYEQPSHYYARPFNFAIHKSLYSSYQCYFDKLECEVYYDYIIDLLRAFRERGDQPHFILNQISSLTHDYINHAGYADRPYSSLLQRIFAQNFNKNTIIFLYSDHGLRYGDILKTQSGIYEQRLPFFYMYIPDELTIDGRNAKALRAMVRVNEHRLTSHIDLHATMMHIIYGQEPVGEPYGRSLFTEIPLNRTCKEAGILDHYCMCNSYIRMALGQEHDRISKELVKSINQQTAAYRNSCVELEFNATLSASIAQNEIGLKKDRHYLVQFETQPNEGIYESTVLVSGDIHDRNSAIKIDGKISRINKYGHQTKCVLGLNKIERFCYCRDLLP